MYVQACQHLRRVLLVRPYAYVCLVSMEILWTALGVCRVKWGLTAWAAQTKSRAPPAARATQACQGADAWLDTLDQTGTNVESASQTATARAARQRLLVRSIRVRQRVLDVLPTACATWPSCQSRHKTPTCNAKSALQEGTVPARVLSNTAHLA